MNVLRGDTGTEIGKYMYTIGSYKCNTQRKQNQFDFCEFKVMQDREIYVLFDRTHYNLMTQ